MKKSHRESERLKIEGEWANAIAKSFKATPPKRAKQARRKKKPAK